MLQNMTNQAVQHHEEVLSLEIKLHVDRYLSEMNTQVSKIAFKMNCIKTNVNSQRIWVLEENIKQLGSQIKSHRYKVHSTKVQLKIDKKTFDASTDQTQI